jgi:dihydroorotase
MAGEADGLLIRVPDDMHVHFRQGPSLVDWVACSAAHFARALAMPNTLPPVTDPPGLKSYQAEIETAAGKIRDSGSARIRFFQPLMAFKLLPSQGRSDVMALAQAGALVGKYYPSGSTTNADDGPASPESVAEALGAMEEAGLVLSIHAEDPLAPVLKREESFLPVVERIAADFPKLRIVVEHLSTAAAVEWMAKARTGIAATISAHHLAFSLDDLMGGGLDPHLFCKPVLKTSRDREALRKAAFSGDERFFFGSDSAPHPRLRKEGPLAPAGVFSSPAALPLLAEIFEGSGKLDRLEGFCSVYGARFYGLPLNQGGLLFKAEPWIVPSEIGGAVPMLAGKTLAYTAKRVDSD